jgi:hypothetical protein
MLLSIYTPYPFHHYHCQAQLYFKNMHRIIENGCSHPSCEGHKSAIYGVKIMWYSDGRFEDLGILVFTPCEWEEYLDLLRGRKQNYKETIHDVKIVEDAVFYRMTLFVDSQVE